MAEAFRNEGNLPSHLMMDEPSAIRALLGVLTALDARLSNLQGLDLTSIRDLVTKARAEIVDASQRDDSARVLMIEADRSIREHAAMSALCFSVLVTLESTLSFLRKAWSGDDFPLAGDVTLDGAVRVYERAKGQFAHLPHFDREDQPIRFVTAVGNTREQMLQNLRAGDEGQALIDIGDVSLVWVSQSDLWSRWASSTLRSATATAPTEPEGEGERNMTKAEELLSFATMLSAIPPETLARILEAATPAGTVEMVAQLQATNEEEPS